MTPEEYEALVTEFIRLSELINRRRDVEDIHADMDDILVKIIGDPRITKAYEERRVWYS